jgi:cysteine desulfurase
MLLDSVDAVQLVDALARQGICISKGSACKSNEAGVSHVLAAMGVSERESRSQVRVSFGHQSTQDDADVLVEAIAREVEDQRELALSKVKYMLGRSA